MPRFAYAGRSTDVDMERVKKLAAFQRKALAHALTCKFHSFRPKPFFHCLKEMFGENTGFIIFFIVSETN